MAFEKRIGSQEPLPGPACVHLRSKSMFVHGGLKAVDNPDDAEGQYCWCNLTQHVLGPDQQHVGRCDCVDGRECFRATR